MNPSPYDQFYTKDTINAMNASIHEKLDQIIIQVTKTNSRVDNLERWRWVLTGFGVALGALSLPNISNIIGMLKGL